MEKTLMHICCAPCSVTCIDTLRSEGIEPVGYWYNPNIHPVTEYRSRRDCLIRYAGEIGMDLRINDFYGLRDFVRAIYPNLENRCRVCYEMRLFETARYAAENGFDSFTTTLFVSPYQNHELLRETAERAADIYKIKLLYRDFRPRFREGQARAREMGFYMQKYCGCVFSEEERYIKKRKTEAGAGK